MTLIGDSVLYHHQGKRKGYQLVIGKNYEIADFIESLNDGTLRIKAPRVALMVGCDLVDKQECVNAGNRIERLVREILVRFSDTQFWVCSLLPRPGSPKEMDELIRRMNGTISTMCKRLQKFNDTTITYVPIHCDFLEKWKHFDNESKRMQYSTRLISQWQRYFDTKDTRCLTPMGVEMAVNSIEGCVAGNKQLFIKKRQNLPELHIQVDNVKSVDDPQVVLQARGTKAGALASKHERCKSASVKRAREKEDDVPNDCPGVSELIKTWEAKSRSATQRCELDDELGEESIVLVNIGDQSMEGSDE